MDRTIGGAVMKQAMEQVEKFGRVVAVYRDRPQNLYQLLTDTATVHPKRIAIQYGERRIPYHELHQRTDLVAEHLIRSWHLKQGDRIAVLLPNIPEFCELLLAAAKAGVIAVLLNTRLTADELFYMIEHSGSRVLFYDLAFAEKADLLQQKFPHVRFVAVGPATHRPGSHNGQEGHLNKEGLSGQEGPPDQGRRFGESYPESYCEVTAEERPVTITDQVEETDPCYIMYTSGTTGTPKGAMTCHMNVIHSAINYREMCGTTEQDCTIIAVPLFHVTGLIGQLVHMLLVGGTSVLLREYSTGELLQSAIQNQVTFIFNVPAVYNLLLLRKEVAQLTTLRLALYGGAPMSPETIMRLRAIFPNLDLRNAYGATETASPTTLMPSGWGMEKVDSVGRPVPGAICKVIKENGKEGGPEEVGELWIKGAMVIPQYWDNQAANRSSFADGFWKSGDMAKIDQDGYVYIMDRKKDIINRGGEKIYSVEIENLLYSHPGILEAAVVGVPDDIFGERVKAFVVPKQQQTLTAEEITEFVRSHLADYKVPREVEFLDALPRNPGGKVLKHMLRERTQEA